jgi:basic membrane protein A
MGWIKGAIYPALVAAGMFGLSSEAASEPKPLNVGLVFDVGGLGDKSFNDAAYEGLQQAEKTIPGVRGEYREPSDANQRREHLRSMAVGDTDLIIGVGFLFTDEITELAEKFPNKKFACVDYTVTGDPIPSNLASLNFREEEGCFLVGAAAALASQSGQIGFVGGVDSLLIRRFEHGYRRGATHVRPDILVRGVYAGISDSAFKDPQRGRELALSLFDRGADIIFHASGSTGLGVFRAAEERGRMAIGVDRDQTEDATSGTIFTSMIKRVDRAVYEIIREVAEGRFRGGVHEYGLKEDAVGYVYDERNSHLWPAGAREKVESLRQDILEGRIQVGRGEN